MSSNQLRLDDCLEDSPQTRALMGVYEADSDLLLDYAQDLNAACQHVAKAQNELAFATQAFTQKLRDYQLAKFALESNDELIKSTLQQLATSIDEVSSFNTVLYTELSENMEYHSKQFLEKDLAEYLRLKSSFQASDKAHEEAAAKLARVSRKKHSEKGWQEATDQLYAARKTFHNTSMLYCCCLNDLQNRKTVGLLKPVISYLQSQIGFFRMGAEVGKEELNGVLSKLSDNLMQLHKDIEENRDISVEQMDRLDAQSTRKYIPDPPASMNFPDQPVDRSRTQISGYLFYRSRSSILSQWHRNYFFTQGGNLMQQSKKQFAGQLFLDLDGCMVGAADVDDRRNAFQVTAADGRRSVVLQGESKQQSEEWISTIRNISAGLYLEDDPREAVIRAHSTSTPPDTNELKQMSEDKPTSVTSEKKRSESSVSGQAERARSSSFENKHESYKPSVFERIKLAATSLITPEGRPVKEEPPAEPFYNCDPEIASGTSDRNLEMVLDSNQPILFDLPSPVVGEHVITRVPQEEVTESSIGKEDNSEQDTSSPQDGAIANVDDNDTGFKAMFVVRFLGCKQIGSDVNLDSSIADTIWQVMAARALYKMFRMNELHLVVSNQSLRMVDPTTQLERDSFILSNVLETKTHADNPRLLGFIARHVNSSQLFCYTFESNADGDDVCCAINTARVMEQSKIEHEETRKQREIESVLEEQSRMISAASMKHDDVKEKEEESTNEDGASEVK